MTLPCPSVQSIRVERQNSTRGGKTCWKQIPEWTSLYLATKKKGANPARL